MPGVFMSTMKHEMPSCFGRVGSRCARGRCPTRLPCAIDVHTFWPLSTQPPSTRVARVESDGEVGTRAGLAEQLAPADLAAQRRQDPPLLLLGRAVARSGSAAPTRRRRCSARATFAARNSSSITSSSSALASRPHGARPARREVAVVARAGRAARAVERPRSRRGAPAPRRGAPRLRGPRSTASRRRAPPCSLARGAHAPLVGRARRAGAA